MPWADKTASCRRAKSVRQLLRKQTEDSKLALASDVDFAISYGRNREFDGLTSGGGAAARADIELVGQIGGVQSVENRGAARCVTANFSSPNDTSAGAVGGNHWDRPWKTERVTRIGG